MVSPLIQKLNQLIICFLSALKVCYLSYLDISKNNGVFLLVDLESLDQWQEKSMRIIWFKVKTIHANIVPTLAEVKISLLFQMNFDNI